MFDNIKMDAKRIPARTDKSDFDDNMVHWSIKLNDQKPFEYSEGIGHFIKQSWGKKEYIPNNLERMLTNKDLQQHALVDVSVNDAKKYLTDRVKFTKGYNARNATIEVSPPKLEDVLYSLTMDSGAVTMTFEDWCDNSGYDTDSKKAEKIFNACRDSFVLLHRLGLNLAELQEYFQDY